MALLTVGKAPSTKQRLYVLEITLPDGTCLIKIGKASGISSKARMMQIVESIFDKYRETPIVKIKRDREVPADMVFKYETILHQFFCMYKYHSIIPFDGVTECFHLESEDAIQAYEAVIEGMIPDFTFEKEEDTLPF